MSINGNLIASQPATPSITLNGTTYWWYDPIYQLQNSAFFDTDIGEYWAQQCFADGSVSGGWVPESEILGQPPPVWNCQNKQAESNNAWCALFDDWASAYLWSQVNDHPMPACTPAVGEAASSDLFIPTGWTTEVETTPNVSVVTVPPDAVLAAVQAMSPTQLSQLNIALNSNPNSSPVTLQGMTKAWQRADVPTQEIFVEVTGIATTRYPENVVSIVGNLPPQFLCSLTQKIILPSATPGNRDGIYTAVEHDESLPETTLAFVPGPPGCQQLKMTIGRDIMSGCDCEQFSLVIPGCASQGNKLVNIPALIRPSMADPDLDIHEGNAFQIIINMLSDIVNALHIECNTYKQFVSLGVFDGVNPIDFEFPTVQIKLVVVDNPDPARINWQPPPNSIAGGVQRFGKWQWKYVDGSVGPVQFFNSSQQLLTVPTDSITGMILYLNDEVVAQVFYKRADYLPSINQPLTPSTT